MARGRSMTLPTSPGRVDAIHKPAQKPPTDPAHGACFIFLHGLGDSAEGLEAVADQFQDNDQIPYMHWVIPNALENKDAHATAWYRPNGFVPADRPELQDTEDEAGMLNSVQYVEALIDACVNKGIPPQRIVLGGFSQGCALALLTDLTSEKYAGKLAGIVGLMGYLPLSNRLMDLRAHAGLPVVHGEVPLFLARGEKDQLIPAHVWKQTLKTMELLGVSPSSMDVKQYSGGHSITGPLLKDMAAFIKRVIPDLGDY